MKILIIILIAISLTSCKHKEKYEFIQRYLENPEKLEEILLSSEFDTEYFRKSFLKSELGRKFYVNWADKFYTIDKNGNKKVYFEVFDYYEGTVSRKKVKVPIYLIYIDNKLKDFRLVFEWELNEKGKWYLTNITKREKPVSIDEEHDVLD